MPFSYFSLKYLYKKFKLSNKDNLLLIYTFIGMIIFCRSIHLSFQSYQMCIFSAGLGMAWNRDRLSWILNIIIFRSLGWVPAPVVSLKYTRTPQFWWTVDSPQFLGTNLTTFIANLPMFYLVYPPTNILILTTNLWMLSTNLVPNTVIISTKNHTWIILTLWVPTVTFRHPLGLASFRCTVLRPCGVVRPSVFPARGWGSSSPWPPASLSRAHGSSTTRTSTSSLKEFKHRKNTNKILWDWKFN